MKRILLAALALLAAFIVACPTGQNKTCPDMKVEPTESAVSPGKQISFSVPLGEAARFPELRYEWKVSPGTIVQGRDRHVVSVDTNGLAVGTNVTATVEIKGLPEGCPNTFSGTKPLVSETPF